ncbi:MAG: DUF4912 domain-containing protein [Bacillota bacterium]
MDTSLLTDPAQVKVDDIIVLMFQEPDCLWTYWEADGEMMSCLTGDPEYGYSYAGNQDKCPRREPSFAAPLMLRLYQSDTSSPTEMVDTLDINVDRLQGSWYIKPSRPSLYYWIDLGLMLRERFVTLLRSCVISLYGDSVGLKTLAYKHLPGAQRVAAANNRDGGEELPSSTEYFQRS